MSLYRLLALAALVVGTPVAAQDSASATVDATATSLPAPDPERLALAERLVDRIWPAGTMGRMMETSMTATADAVEGMEAAVDWGGAGSDKATRRAQHEARTGRPLTGSSASDAEGPANAMADFNATMAPMFERMEPPLRAAIARIYARRYDVTQLGELEAFFSTPTGAAYAADSLTLMSDPEMVAAMSEAMGGMMGALMGVDGAASDAAAEATAAVDAAAAADAGVVKYE